MTVVRNLSDYRESRKQQEAIQPTEKGFALFHRKIMDCGFYKDSQAVHLWFHLVMKATHKPVIAETEFGNVSLVRGQCITGRHKLASETGISPDRIQYLLRKFVSMEMIGAESNRKFTVISILKYDEYQSDFLPTDYQQITNANPHGSKAVASIVPTDSQQITTYKEITNNSITNVIETPSDEIKPEKKKSGFSCEDVVKAYHEILPEAKGIRALTDKRRNLIRTFWVKASKVTRQLDGTPFTLDSWKAYLNYIATNCRWMLEDRPDNRSGKTWQKKGLEYFLSDETYVQVREGSKDDR